MSMLLRFLLAIIAGQKSIASHKFVVLGTGMVILWVAVAYQLYVFMPWGIAVA